MGPALAFYSVYVDIKAVRPEHRGCGCCGGGSRAEVKGDN